VYAILLEGRAAKAEEMKKIPWKEASEGQPAPEEQYQENSGGRDWTE